jgi:hypothetical protein
MLKLILDQQVVNQLKVEYSHKSAEEQLGLYVEKFEELINESLNYDRNPHQLRNNYYSVPTTKLSRDGPSIGTRGKNQIKIDKWLKQKNLSLYKVVTEGSNLTSLVSEIQLTKLVTVVDTLDSEFLAIREINTDAEILASERSSFLESIFPNIIKDSESLELFCEKYDFLEVDIDSLENYSEWLERGSHYLSELRKQTIRRQINYIKEIAKCFNSNNFLQKRKPSKFGRTYYHGTSIQNVNKQLRRAILGNCYEYDITSSVVAWKMGFAKDCYKLQNTDKDFERFFAFSLVFVQDKKDFLDGVIYDINKRIHNFNDSLFRPIIKKAITAFTFGARLTTNGWRDDNGSFQYSAINSIIKDREIRKAFIESISVSRFVAEQKILDKYILDFFKTQCPHLCDLDFLRYKSSNRLSNSKFMAYLYQVHETNVMDVARKYLFEKFNITPIANIHDAIILRNKLSSDQYFDLIDEMRFQTSNQYWSLTQKEINRYESVNYDALQEEKEHKLRIQEEAKLAEIYIHERLKLGLGISSNDGLNLY